MRFMAYEIPRGVYAKEHLLAPGEQIEYLYASKYEMLTATIRLDNANSYPSGDEVIITMIGFGKGFTTQYTLTSFRYGVYLDEVRLNKLIIKNKSDIATAQVYIETLTKPIAEYPNEVVQFITQINTSQPPNNQALYQGSNNRYTGTLTNATFLQSVPIGTPMAVRQINAQNTSSSAVGFVTIPWAENFTFNANIEPLGIINFTTTFAFHTDAITNQLPASATLTNTTVNYVMIDYYFDYSIECVFDNTYTITTSGSTTYINFNGYGFIYFYTNQNLPIANETINFTQSNTQYTLSPASGTSNSNGQVPFTISEALNSTTTFPSDIITASSDIAGISKSASVDVIPSGFNFTNSTQIETVYNPTSYNGPASVVFNQNTSLTGNIIAYSVTIDSGVTLTTNGYSIICNSDFINNGTIITGSGGAGGGAGSNGTSITTSYAGSGGGGGGSDNDGGGASGGSTVVAGGGGGSGAYSAGNGGNGGNGNTPSAPSINTSTIQTWYNNGIQNYLAGAGGGGGNGGGCNGGNGGAGIYIQAMNITAGSINSSGSNGSSPLSAGGGGGGGGGGGSILLAYSSTYNAGTYNTSGGSGAPGRGGGVAGVGGLSGGRGGNGGNGLVLTYQFTTPPITPSTGATVTATIQTTQSTPEPIPNQTVNFTISGSGPASFSSTSSVLTTSGTTNSSGQATVTIYNANGTNTLTASCTIANITQTAQITI